MFKKILSTSAAALLVVTGLGVGIVQSANASPAKPSAVGACANKSTGSLRLLEPTRLHRSQYGKCRSTERRVPLPTVDGLPKIPAPAATVVFKRATGTESCVKQADTVLTYVCTIVPTPTP